MDDFNNKNQIHFISNVNLIDDENEFFNYWNEIIKNEFLQRNFIKICLNEKETTKKLSEFNINLLLNNNNENENFFTIKITKIKSEKDLKNDSIIKNVINNYSSENLNVLIFNISNSSDSQLKLCNKILEKIKEKTNINDFIILGYNKKNNSYIPNLNEIFINLFQKKFEEKFNLKLIFYKNFVENNKNFENLFEFLKHFFIYLKYLKISEFYEEILNIINKYFNINNENLNKNFQFNVPLKILNFDNENIYNKILSQKLSSIEYFQYLLFNYLESCRILRNYKEFNFFLDKFFNFLNKNYKKYFSSENHFYFWLCLFINEILLYVKYVKKINGINETFMLIEIVHINLLNYLKKFMKIYAKFCFIEIPNEKILNFVITKNDLKEEFNNILNEEKFNEIIEKNFKEFKSDINKYFNKETCEIFLNKNRFLNEYLTLLENINILYSSVKNNKLIFKNNLELIYLKFLFNQFEECKKILINIIKEFDFINNNNNNNNKNWKLIFDYLLIHLFLILISIKQKSIDDLKLISKYLNITIENIDKIINLFGINKNDFYNLISNYINNENIKEEFEINFNEIINLKFNNFNENNNNNNIYINKINSTKKEIKNFFSNKTSYFFNIENIVIIFKELNSENNNNNILKYSIKNQFQIKSNENNNDLNLIIDFNNDFKLNSKYEIISINFISKNNINFNYKIQKSFIFIIQNLNIEIDSKIFPSFINNNNNNLIENKNIFYYNTLFLLEINFKKLEEFKENILQIELIPNEFQIHENKISFLKETFNNILITENKIEFPENSINETNKNETIKIPFFIENLDFYSNSKKELKIKITIIKNNEIIFINNSKFSLNLIHLFNFKNKFRLLNNNNYLMNTIFSLNIEIENMKIFLNNNNKNKINFNHSSAINIVNSLPKKIEEIKKILSNKFLEFSIKNDFYFFCFPIKNITNQIKNLFNINYYIKIDFNKNKKFKLFEEIEIEINVNKLNDKNVLFKIDMIENENWGFIGKKKIIENFKNKTNVNFKFNIFSLIDGFVKLPEFEFSEFEIENNLEKNKYENVKIMNFNSIEFDSVIEGNQKIIQIHPENKSMLKVNII